MIFGPLLAAEQFSKTEEGGGRETPASIHRELRMSAKLRESEGLRPGTRERERKGVASFVVLIARKAGKQELPKERGAINFSVPSFENRNGNKCSSERPSEGEGNRRRSNLFGPIRDFLERKRQRTTRPRSLTQWRRGDGLVF